MAGPEPEQHPWVEELRREKQEPSVIGVNGQSPFMEQDPDAVAEREAIQEEERTESFIDWAPGFLGTEDPPVEYIIPELMPKGVIKDDHGDPRTMKTLAALEQSIAAATGTAAFQLERFTPARQYRVLYSSQEDAARIVRPRVKGLLRGRGITDFPDTLAFAVHKGISFDLPEWRERFLEEVIGFGFELIIIDPIRAYTAHADKGPADVMPIAKFFRQLAVRGITVNLVHHDVKPPASGPDTRRRSHRASGGAWFSVSECPVAFEKIGDGKSLVSPEDFKFSADPAPFTISYSEDKSGIRLIGETTSASEATTLTVDEGVLAYLAEHPGASGRAVAKGVRKGAEAVADSLERLLVTGAVDCVDLGPGKGKKWTLR